MRLRVVTLEEEEGEAKRVERKLGGGRPVEVRVKLVSWARSGALVVLGSRKGALGR